MITSEELSRRGAAAGNVTINYSSPEFVRAVGDIIQGEAPDLSTEVGRAKAIRNAVRVGGFEYPKGSGEFYDVDLKSLLSILANSIESLAGQSQAYPFTWYGMGDAQHVIRDAEGYLEFASVGHMHFKKANERYQTIKAELKAGQTPNILEGWPASPVDFAQVIGQ